MDRSPTWQSLQKRWTWHPEQESAAADADVPWERAKEAPCTRGRAVPWQVEHLLSSAWCARA